MKHKKSVLLSIKNFSIKITYNKYLILVFFKYLKKVGLIIGLKSILIKIVYKSINKVLMEVMKIILLKHLIKNPLSNYSNKANMS
jgi:hypothetical protein